MQGIVFSPIIIVDEMAKISQKFFYLMWSLGLDCQVSKCHSKLQYKIFSSSFSSLLKKYCQSKADCSNFQDNHWLFKMADMSLFYSILLCKATCIYFHFFYEFKVHAYGLANLMTFEFNEFSHNIFLKS